MLTDTINTTLNIELKERYQHTNVRKISDTQFVEIPTTRNSQRTAIKRNKLSRPLKMLLEKGLIKGRVLDYGCGHGYDAKEKGFDKYDPFYYPNGLDDRKKYDTIVCSYVLNVLEPIQECKVIADISRRLANNGRAYFTVRRDNFKEGISKAGTYQRQSYPLLKSLFKRHGSFETYVLIRGNNE